MPSWRATYKQYQALDRQLWVLAGVRCASTAALSLGLAFVGAYLVVERGLSGFTYGLVAFSANIVQSIVSAYVGDLSDRIGRRGILLWSLVARAVVLFVMGLFIAQDAAVWPIAACVIVNAALRGGFEPACSALVADLTPEAMRVSAFGLQRIGVNAGWALGPALGGLMAEWVGYGTVFLLAAPLVGIPAIFIARSIPKRRRLPTALRDKPFSLGEAFHMARSEPAFLWFMGCVFVYALVHIQQYSVLQNYAMAELGLDRFHMGLIYTLNGVLVVTLQVPVVALLARTHVIRAQMLGVMLYTIALFCEGLASGLPGLLIAASIMTTGEVFVAPSQQATMAELGDPNKLGRVYGLFGSAQMIGTATAPIIGGLAFDYLRGQHVLMWSVLASLGLLLLLLYAGFARALRKTELRPLKKVAPEIFEVRTEVSGQFRVR